MLTKSHTNTKKKKNEHEIFNVIPTFIESINIQQSTNQKEQEELQR